MTLEPEHLRRVFGAFPTGVTAIAAVVDQAPVGLAANSFTSVSLNPPMVSVCLARASTTWPVLRRATRLGVSVLGEHQEWLSRQLSARGVDRFAGARWRILTGGGVLFEDCSAWLDCSIDQVIPAGDHDIVLLRVHDLDANPLVSPLVFHASGYPRLGGTVNPLRAA
ncbi:flavin reductase family protein [Rugosimonospora africana]|uniref:Oxidoreductase n=1 Tax=Rugosimonospora africana TaxID=556532 RepID=A0A8J3R1L8_9ACTN|nr:flavin reductase family protein [Rugosimonospora africana]GIH20167.1 oxidoreductase [Rugosimonospora africana]